MFTYPPGAETVHFVMRARVSGIVPNPTLHDIRVMWHGLQNVTTLIKAWANTPMFQSLKPLLLLPIPVVTGVLTR
jgi:hypothetical protein